MQWFPALDRVAKQRHWRLVGLTKSGCPAADATVYLSSTRGAYTNCDGWREAALDRITEQEKPDLVVIGGLATYRTAGPQGGQMSAEASHRKLVAGYEHTVERLRASGARVELMHDTPRPGDVRECVAQHLKKLKACATPVEKATGYDPIMPQVAAGRQGVQVIDPTPELCRDDECPAVIGNALVYRNSNHLTATFVQTMTPWLERQLPQHLGDHRASSSASS
jgi:hypothetical protein